MSKYNTNTIDELLNDYFGETNESIEDFSNNAGIDIGFVRQMLDGKRYPSTNLDNPLIIEKISAYTGDTFEDVYKSALNSKIEIEERRAKQMEIQRQRLEKQAEERRKLEEMAREEREKYIKSLSVGIGHEITLIKEKQPIMIYGGYDIFELGRESFIKHENNIYNISYVTKISEFEYVIDKDGNVVKDYKVKNGNIIRKPVTIRI